MNSCLHLTSQRYDADIVVGFSFSLQRMHMGVLAVAVKMRWSE